ncbi:MAG: cytochrome c biogenesis protein CcsA [Gammaproteobacteria bacterium]|jgi:heme exporter protein C|nr:cytochrome c biogenesis protein CcsA [Gammaproteobacteria bacterium]MBT3859549.1 cytochrome c biogenesis protein CcsA [Gammaproteobacteria bacterium]MBT3986557.1 cytochrome c biogenesis protein CcsA [Gammaproteobacteria bacterium]MBT4256297.1 cytochrome c biogenesis protein CcsA [Gammaproteobacteria bacterium]MBT4581099.1 cytochrome c biogenesis protein CcsA [Gammaproteobacteria bacterium]
MWLWFSKLGSPKWFYELSGKWLPWLVGAMIISMTVAVVWALLYLPPDYQQGYTSRILVVHVAVAGTSLAFFPLMAVAGTITLVWKMKLADMVAKNAAALGAWFSFITLATGSLWGSVMWGTWWEWTDARLVSMLFQFFLLLGVVSLRSALEDPDKAAKACALLSIVGCINVVIIKYSVEWWNVLHQPSSPLSVNSDSPNGPEFWIATIIMVLAVYLFLSISLILATRNEILQRERRAQWVQELVRNS